MDIQKQTEYWRSGSLSDIDTAGILIDKNILYEGMFFCHLAIEKIIKALYVKNLPEYAQKSITFLCCAKNQILSQTQMSNSFLEY